MKLVPGILLLRQKPVLFRSLSEFDGDALGNPPPRIPLSIIQARAPLADNSPGKP
jgi:hypothetical protein